jgi:hypothetical protein
MTYTIESLQDEHPGYVAEADAVRYENGFFVFYSDKHGPVKFVNAMTIRAISCDESP